MRPTVEQAIFSAIAEYAIAYARLEAIQRKRPNDLPRGDQKTGVIAEFFARIFSRTRFPKATLEFGTTSEHAWDLRVIRSNIVPLHIQVKAVSAHADIRGISPLHPGWNELWLMRLDKSLSPEGFWCFRKNEVSWSHKTIKSSTMPRRTKPKTGSAIYREARDKLPELLRALKTVSINSLKHARRLRTAFTPPP